MAHPQVDLHTPTISVPFAPTNQLFDMIRPARSSLHTTGTIAIPPRTVLPTRSALDFSHVRSLAAGAAILYSPCCHRRHPKTPQQVGQRPHTLTRNDLCLCLNIFPTLFAPRTPSSSLLVQQPKFSRNQAILCPNLSLRSTYLQNKSNL